MHWAERVSSYLKRVSFSSIWQIEFALDLESRQSTNRFPTLIRTMLGAGTGEPVTGTVWLVESDSWYDIIVS